MAAGPLPLGIAAFAAVKLAGYTLAGRTLNRANHVTRPRPLAFGAARTLLGIIAGVSYAMILARFGVQDRKSTRLNSSHLVISYAVFCLKKKKNTRAREHA